MDILTKAQRSERMGLIRSKNTKVEWKLRKLLWKNGLRGYRVHTKLIGRPDLYFAKQKLAVFIDGCFWHGCPHCYVQPKSNKSYWIPKIAGNKQRDKTVNKLLKEQEIKVIRMWEHEVNKKVQKCYNNIVKALNR